MKLATITHATLAAALLDAKSAAAPNGQVHVSVARQYQDPDSGEVYTLDSGDGFVTDAALVQRAADLFRDLAQHWADRNQVTVRPSGDKTVPTLEPRAQAPTLERA